MFNNACTLVIKNTMISNIHAVRCNCIHMYELGKYRKYSLKIVIQLIIWLLLIELSTKLTG